jgi:alpha-galactosidase
VILLNRAAAEKEIGFSWENIGYPSHLTAGVRDLWQAKDLGQFKGKFSAPVAPHSVVMVRVAP